MNDWLYLKKFGRLTALYPIDDYVSPKGSKKRRWLCICNCNNYCAVTEQYLKNGTTKSCGCLRKEVVINTHQKYLTKHNEAHSRLYNVWHSMKSRCFNKNRPQYKNYGGRGITVCEDWLDYIAFRDWSIANGYDSNAPRGQCTLDRIDVDGNYCPENCQWINMLAQQNNRTNNRKYTYNGETKTLKQWAEDLGIDRTTLTYRIDKSGMTFEEAIAKPIRR